MNSSDIGLLEFIGILADINKQFVKLSIIANKGTAIRSTSISIIPTRQSPSEYLDEGVKISLTIDAELTTPLDANRQAIGASLSLRRSAGVWIAEAEMGWSGADIGWDTFDLCEVKQPSFTELASNLPEVLIWLSERFRSEVEKLASRT